MARATRDRRPPGEAREGRRTASGIPAVPALDGFRAYAVLLIVALHVLGLSGALDVMRGSTSGLVTWALVANGIDALFIISGFVLFLPVVARGGSLGGIGDFALGRAARLLPAYWASLAAVILLIALVPVGGLAVPSVSSIALHLAALQMPAKMLSGELAIGFGLNGPVWLISVIVGFYFVLPLVARPYLRHPLLGLLVAAAVTVGWKELVLNFGGAFDALAVGSAPPSSVRLTAVDQLPGWAFSFALGMTAAWGYVRLRARDRTALAGRAAVVAALALPAYGLFAYLYARTAYLTSAPVSPSVARLSPWSSLGGSASRALLMAAVALGPYWLARPFANRLTGWVAGISYGLYLIHLVVGAYAGLLLGLPTDGRPATVALWFGTVLPLSLLGAYLTTRFVERPARRLVHRYEEQRKRPTPGRVPAGAAVEPHYRT